MKTAGIVFAALSFVFGLVGSIWWWVASQRIIGFPIELKSSSRDVPDSYELVDAHLQPEEHINAIRETFRDVGSANAVAAGWTATAVLFSGISTILLALSN